MKLNRDMLVDLRWCQGQRAAVVVSTVSGEHLVCQGRGPAIDVADL